jgi:general secretion pathway protein G
MPFLPINGRRSPRRDGQSGVTLIEMMIVLVIIGIVAALVVPNVIGRPDEARGAVAIADLRTISASLEMYRLDNRMYPTTAQGLAALSEKPADAPLPPNWVSGGYLSQVPTDPWGNPYVYRVEGSGGGYTLVSLGADGQPGGEGVDADVQSGNGQVANGAGG